MQSSAFSGQTENAFCRRSARWMCSDSALKSEQYSCSARLATTTKIKKKTLKISLHKGKRRIFCSRSLLHGCRKWPLPRISTVNRVSRLGWATHDKLPALCTAAAEDALPSGAAIFADRRVIHTKRTVREMHQSAKKHDAREDYSCSCSFKQMGVGWR